MMDWTDRHCRFFHRLLTRRALIYTEMLTTGAVLNGDRARLLGFDPFEHPVALQLGGCEPAALAQSAHIGEDAGFDEINLNVGCPSDRVQEGRFGACLMAEPALVADGVAAMKAAVRVPVTVKCRIGIDDQDPQETLFGFAAAVKAAGADALVVHARKAWLKGLSPKENRAVPPLDYALVRRLKAAHPDFAIMLNGGIASLEQAQAELGAVDGVMMGRAAYQEPWRLLNVDPLFYGEPAPFASAKEAGVALIPYIERALENGVRLSAITRHVLGLFRAVPGARAFRRHLATEAVKPGAGAAGPGRGARPGAGQQTGHGAHGCLTYRLLGQKVLGHSLGEIALLAGWIAGAGILVGILAGLFGIGGGAIIVPVLYEVFRALGVPEDVRMQLCIGTSLAIIVPTTVSSYLGHKKKGAAIANVVRIWALPAVVGVAIGSVAASYAPSALFKIAFIVFASFIATRMLFGSERWSLGKELPGRGLLTLYGFVTGLFSSLVGVSGGAVSNAVLTLYGQPMQRAVATSAGVGVPITIAGTVGYMLAGWRHMAVAAAAVDRLRLADRLRADGAGIELHDALWRAPGTLAAAPPARDRLRHFSGDRGAAVFGEFVLKKLARGNPPFGVRSFLVEILLAAAQCQLDRSTGRRYGCHGEFQGE